MSGMDENNTADATLFMDRLGQLQRLLNCTIILVHHTNKGRDEMRGSSVFHGAMDTMFAVKRKDNACIITNVKQKEADEWADPVVLKATPVGQSLVLSRPEKAPEARQETQRQKKSLDELAAAHEASLARKATARHDARTQEWGECARNTLDAKFKQNPEATFSPYALAKIVSETVGGEHGPIMDYLRNRAWRDILQDYVEMEAGASAKSGRRIRVKLFSMPKGGVSVNDGKTFEAGEDIG
jgi:hypothetical protein